MLASHLLHWLAVNTERPSQGGTVYTSTAIVAVTQNGAPAGAAPIQ
mgnify:CR=1 FL=1